MGNTVILPLDLNTPIVNSLPLINSSTKICVSSLNAFSNAIGNSTANISFNGSTFTFNGEVVSNTNLKNKIK